MVELLSESPDRREAAVQKAVDDASKGLRGIVSEVRTGFRDVRHDIQDLSEKSISLSEQDEIWHRIRRIEKHVGLPQDLQSA